MGQRNVAKMKLITSMTIFGTIGIFVKYIPLPSGVIALARGVIGMVFLLLITIVAKKRPNFTEIRKHLFLLILSGVALGINWILLFEAYHYTTVATATLCYYLAPIFVVVVSMILLKERLTLRKVVCVGTALVGMVFVSGILRTGIKELSELQGILLGICAAVFYATVVLLNKKLADIPAYDKTIVQLGVSAFVMFFYSLFMGDLKNLTLEVTPLVLLLVVGILHTGVAYALYFGSMKELKAQTVALFSYIDPVVAIILSALLLKEPLGEDGVIGAILVLGATLLSELPERRENIE